LIDAAGYTIVGPVKLETSARVRAAAPPLFGNDRPIVLYNAHKAPKLSSWKRFVAPMLAAFAQQDRFNLIVAPHIKMFRRRRASVRAAWERRSSDTILVDVESDRLLDMTYTLAADIYVGDVSSQVYEFLSIPRPCVFLNAGRHSWRDDPNFMHWHLGDVVDDPDELMAAINAAPARHMLYRAKQEAFAAASLGPRDPGSATRAADAILAAIG
jgi:CDP-glycerol glycerophosphotransferase (TagB/SpsB family)